MKVYERLAQAFVTEGTRTIFGLIGDGNMFWMHAMDKLGVRVIDVRHEGSGVGMADGWARATRQVGVATATNGPGVTQLATGLVTAARASSPIVVFVGDSQTNNPDHMQRFDQATFAKACETELVQVLSPETVDLQVRKAFYVARTESRPVLLSCPRDIQQRAFEDDDPYTPSGTLLSRVSIAPSPPAIAEAADAITQAEKVVLILGRGAIWSEAGDAALALARRTGAIIATTLQAKTFLAEDPYHVGISGLYATRTAMHLFHEAGVVIGVGASLNPYTTEHGYLYPNATFIQLDILPHRMMGDGRAADVYVHTDARLGAEALEAELARRGVQKAGYRTQEVQAQLVNHFDDPTRYDIEPDLLDPREVCKLLDELVPTDFALLTGDATASGFATMMINRPRKVLGSKFYACIGQTLPAAIGAVAALDHPTVMVDGDGSVIMHLAELDTAAREGLPLLVVVLNDEALGSEYHKFEAQKMEPDRAVVRSPDLGAIMRDMGGNGILARSLDEVRAAIQAWVANPGIPTVIDARISRRVLTLPYRRVFCGHDV